MRVTTYFATLVALVFTTLLNFLSLQRPDWFTVLSKEIIYTKVIVNYGLSQRCQLTISQTSNGKFSYRNYECRLFPTGEKDYCKEEGFQSFCIAWRSAYYLDQIALGVAAVALVAVLFGVTTHSRRMRTWRAVAGLIILTATCQITVFALVTDLYSEAAYPSFERARPALGYIIHTISWVLNIVIALGIITSGLSADSGHGWAAGNDAYQPIA